MARFTIDYLLVGFKYIGNTTLALVEQGFEVPFGYEEAIGFMIGSEIRDKDGVAAAVWTCFK
jgi:phosphomannomutase